MVIMDNEEMPTGKVYLIGAGAGEQGLITERGAAILRQVDVVCYDSLVDPVLIVTLPSRVKRIFVGKRAGRHSMPQEEIEKLLVDLAHQGKIVARLKGGDPFIFGRGGEEALKLAAQGIAYEVVPGVTAAIASAVYAGMPLTQRGFANSAVLFTARFASSQILDDEQQIKQQIEQLGALKESTLVGYMGVCCLPEVVAALLRGGMSPSTPAAMIENGATVRQRIVRTTLENLPQEAERENVQAPALIVVGEVVELGKKLDWYRPGIIAGKRILVTRPVERAKLMYDLLRFHGASVVPSPAIEIRDYSTDPAWGIVLNRLKEGGWLVFTSVSGVHAFFSQILRLKQDIRCLKAFRIAAIGQETAAALNNYHLRPDCLPKSSLTSALAETLKKEVSPGEFVVRIRGNLGDYKIEEALREVGAETLSLVVYHTLTAELDDSIRAWVEEAPLDLITFTSGSTVHSFFKQWGETEALLLIKDAAIASIGPITSQTLRSYGLEIAIEAKQHDVPGLVKAIVEWCEDKRF